jgi:transposase
VKRQSCYDSLAESAGGRMARFVEGMDRGQATLLPECLEDWVDENNPVRAVDVFVEALDLVELGFDGAQPARYAM